MIVHHLYINGLVYRIKQFYVITVLLCVVSTVIELRALYITKMIYTKYIYKNDCLLSFNLI